MQTSGNIFRLEGVVQHYSWGGKGYLPALLGRTNAEGYPWAEYWMGAHPKAPAILRGQGVEQLLDQALQENGAVWLGEKVRARFGGLPYLFKVLDVQDMLSIQVHPSQTAAAIEFDREEARGIPLDAPHRNYKDRNHKPELMWALGSFWLLHGFLVPEKLEAQLQAEPELGFLLSDWQNAGYRGIYQRVMEMGQEEVNTRLQPLIDRILPLYEEGHLPKTSPAFWAARAYKTFCSAGYLDRGLFSIYFFNIVHLERGQAIFQDAGVLHAYLEGQNLELMANSDNVLRGGLTTKHVDVPELMKHVLFAPTVPAPLQEVYEPEEGYYYYPTPAADFELHRWALAGGEERTLVARTTEIYVLMEGTITVAGAGEEMVYKGGESFLATKGAAFKVRAAENSSLFRATLPH